MISIRPNKSGDPYRSWNLELVTFPGSGQVELKVQHLGPDGGALLTPGDARALAAALVNAATEADRVKL